MDDTQEATRVNNPPYISANIWQLFFEKMQRVNKPSQLSVELLKEYGLPTAHSELLSALRFLHLINAESRTTDKFVGIQLKGDAFKAKLKEIIEDAYRDLLEKHPLEHATYDDLQNYFAIKYSAASAKKMAKSFAVLCQFAELQSPAFSKMRSMADSGRPTRQISPERRDDPIGQIRTRKPSGNAYHPQEPSGQDELLKEFIRTNPMPTGIQWDAETLKAFFEQYRQTVQMLRRGNEGAAED